MGLSRIDIASHRYQLDLGLGDVSNYAGQAPIAPAAPASSGALYVVLGCSSSKLDGCHYAQHLYKGELFRLGQAWISAALGGTSGYYILSAKHGLLAPCDSVESYDETLFDRRDDRRWFADKVLSQIASGKTGADRPRLLGDFGQPGTSVILLCPERYGGWTSSVEGLTVYRPMAGLGIGHQKQKLAAMARYVRDSRMSSHGANNLRAAALASLEISL